MTKRHKGSVILKDDDINCNDSLSLSDSYGVLSSSKTPHNSGSRSPWKKFQSGKAKEVKVLPTAGTKKQTTWISSSFDGFVDISSSQDKPKRANQRNIEQSFNAGVGKTVQPSTRQDEDLWLDKHCPKSEADLAVHKKKLAEVRGWILDHLCVKPCSAILLLTGPSGSGKTATIHVLASELNFEVQEWINPVSNNQDNEAMDRFSTTQSQVRQFQDFLLRANKYPTLSIFSANTATVKKVILVEDLPNLFYRDPAKLHEVLSTYRQTGRSPVVFVVSDSHHGDSNVHRLFSKEVQYKLGICNISFNPVAHTSLVKAMNRITCLECRQGKPSFSMPSKEAIDLLAQNSGGDIRTAINGLQFSCSRDKSNIFNEKSSQIKKTCKSKTVSTLGKQKRKSSGKSQTAQGSQESQLMLYGNEKDPDTTDGTVTAIGGKDTAMFLFRALGKILYCKRDLSLSDKELLPSRLSHCARNTLLFCPEDVLERTHLTSEMFNLYLHQNYLDFFSNIDDVTEASEILSDADFLTKEWMHQFAMREYSSSLAARGLVFYNVTRSGSNSTATGRGWRPFHKPQWFDVNKRMREGCNSARDLFRGYFWPSVVLQTEILPYLAITDVPLRTPVQISFLESIGKFRKTKSSFRSFPETLDEKDCGTGSDDEVSLSSSQQTIGSSTSNQGPKRNTVEECDSQGTPEMPQDKDDIIEDFDDD